MTTPNTLVIYSGDASYAFPMLVSARSVRECTPTPFDLWLFAVDFPDHIMANTEQAAAQFGAKVVPLSSADYLRFDPARYRTEFAHLKPATLSRLVTGPHIPERYDQVLYIDGDTLCVGDLSPLIQHRAPPGRLLAVRDPINYVKRDSGPYAAGRRALMEEIGLSVDDTWFNCGVILAERRTWAACGESALDYYAAHAETCPYPVDGSTNVTARGRWLPISSRWNFMAPMRLWGLDDAVGPALYHFTGREKPWLGPVSPWRDIWPHYAIRRKAGAAAELAGPMACAGEIAAINRHRALGRLKSATVHAARAARARQAVMDSEREVVI